MGADTHAQANTHTHTDVHTEVILRNQATGRHAPGLKQILATRELSNGRVPDIQPLSVISEGMPQTTSQSKYLLGMYSYSFERYLTISDFVKCTNLFGR